MLVRPLSCSFDHHPGEPRSGAISCLPSLSWQALRVAAFVAARTAMSAQLAAAGMVIGAIALGTFSPTCPCIPRSLLTLVIVPCRLVHDVEACARQNQLCSRHVRTPSTSEESTVKHLALARMCDHGSHPRVCPAGLALVHARHWHAEVAIYRRTTPAGNVRLMRLLAASGVALTALGTTHPTKSYQRPTWQNQTTDSGQQMPMPDNRRRQHHT